MFKRILSGLILTLSFALPAKAALPSGTVRFADGSDGFLEFELRSAAEPALATYRGRGWVEVAHGRRQIVLVGDNGSFGFGLIARAE